MLKKTILLLCIIIAAPALSAVSIADEDLFDMVVPMNYDSLEISGGMGSNDALRAGIPFDGGNPSLELHGNALYRFVSQDDDHSLYISGYADAYLRLRQTSSLLRLGVGTNAASFRSYTIELAGRPGFYQGTLSNASFRINTQSSSVRLELPLYAGVGVGRIYEISSVLEAKLLHKHLGLTNEAVSVRQTAENLKNRNQRLNPMTDNFAQLKLEYYQDRANAMGIPGREAELLVITESQRFAFERQRLTGLVYGWEVSAGLNADTTIVFTAPSLNIDFGPMIQARFAGLLMENMLHYLAAGTLNLGYDTAPGNLHAELRGTGAFRYLPEDWHWYIDADGWLSIGHNGGFTIDIGAQGSANYMINPNFTVHAGARLALNGFSLNAGGTMRVW